MEWYIFALLAPAFWALNNVIIKFLITNKFRSSLSLMFTVISCDAVFAVAVLIFGSITYSFPYSFLALAVGLMPLTAFWFYSKALITEEVTRIVTLFQLIPVFVVVLSVIFLNEILGIQRYLGIGLIVMASILVSYRKTGKKPFSGALKFMIPFGIIIAAYTIIDKALLGYLDFWTVFFWNLLGTFLGSLILLTLPKPRAEITKAVLAAGKKAVFTTFIGEGLYVIGTICSLIALSLADASLASSLFGLQPFYVFFYTIVLSLFLPKFLQEKSNKETLLLKTSAIILMFTGTWLIV
jgi:drug/metabolite transporter (DMT)-like permease